MDSHFVKYIYLAIIMLIVCIVINVGYTRSSAEKEVVFEHELTEEDIYEMQNTIRP